MPDKRCENGHFIDASWDLCPYCPAPPVERMAIVRPAAAGPVDAPPPRRTRASGEAPLPPLSREAERSYPASIPPPQRTVAVPRPDRFNTPQADAPRYVVGWLVAISGTSKGESFALRVGRNVIGRDRRSDVVIVDDQASAHHADLVFRPEERRFILMDHNSTNGTFVNDEEIAPRRDLQNKDIIRIGTQSFLFFALCNENFSWDEQGQLR